MPTWLTRFSRVHSTTLGLLLTLMVLLLFWLDAAHQTQKPFMVAPLHRLELLASDLRFRVRGSMAPGPEVVIAAIDEQSIDELGRWPWPYTVQAQLIRRLTSYGAAAIGYDVVFSSSDTSAGLDNLQTIQASLAARGYYDDAELQALVEHTLAAANHDQLFATALQESGRTILGYFFHWQCQDVAHLPAKRTGALSPQSDHLEKRQVCPQSGARGQPGGVALIPGLCGRVQSADFIPGRLGERLFQ